MPDFKPFLIADVKTGLELDKPTFLVPNDAFKELNNAYLFRRRIKKKLGCSLLGRLRRTLTSQNLGNTDGSGNFSGNIVSLLSLDASSQIAPGSISIVVGAQTFTEPATPNGTLTNGGSGTGTINYATGALTLNTDPNLAATAVVATFSYYPGLPNMGDLTRDLTAINAEELVSFDTKYAYTYNNASAKFVEAPSTLSTTWSGGNADFFWGYNAYNALFVTNGIVGLHGYTPNRFQNSAGTTVDVRTTVANNLSIGDQVIFINLSGSAAANNGFRGQVTGIIAPNEVTINSPEGETWTNDALVTSGVMIVSNQNLHGDGIRWYDGSTWMNFNPPVNGVTALMGCEMIFFYRDRIVALNTYEGNSLSPSATNYPQRARWSQNGTPFAITPVPSGANIGSGPNAWREDVPGSGGYVDCPTQEKIVSACFLKDILIVFFEHSTWKLRYTNNEILPFVWERINAEFGSEGTFSTVFFDIGPLTVGSRGIIQTNGVNVDRIDLLIPDEVFEFNNGNSGPDRVQGIRDFNLQLVYWAFPNDLEDGTYPNRVLCYNYKDSSWAIFRDSFTSFGKWQSFADLTWGDATMTWEEADFPWNDFTKKKLYESTVGGNQQGYISVIQSQTTNDVTLRIESISGNPALFTSTAHNLTNLDVIRIENCIGDFSSLNDVEYGVQVVDANTFYLYTFTEDLQSFSTPVTTTGTYLGLGEIARVDNFVIRTKKFNPSLSESHQTQLGWVDFYTDATSSGAFTVNVYVDGNDSQPVNTPLNNAISDDDDMLNSRSNQVITYLNEFDTKGQTSVWHSLYNCQSTGNFFTLEMTLSDNQLNDIDVYGSDLTIYAINVWAADGSDRLS